MEAIFRYLVYVSLSLGFIVGIKAIQPQHDLTRTSFESSPSHSRFILEPRLGLPCPVELDYSPQCICDFWPYDTYNAYCNASSVEELNAITSTFEKTPIVGHTEVKITLTGSQPINIPANMLSNKAATSIIFECKGESAGLGTIHPQAFISSAAATSMFQIMFCDLTDFDFAFLDQLRMLHTLRLYNTTLMTMAKMPLMPHLRTIELYAPIGFQEWHDPAQTPYLDTITINAAIETDETTIERIVEKLLYYENSLERLYLVNLGLTRVPSAVRNMSRLNQLDLSENLIRELPIGSLDLMSSLSSLWMANLPIETIYPGAFQGNFRTTLIYMVFGKLSNLPRETFEELLEEMLQGSGSFDLYGNPVTCDDCHLSWLINEKRYLLTRISAYCANGTSFAELDSGIYETRCLKSASTFAKAEPLMFVLILVLVFYFA